MQGCGLTTHIKVTFDLIWFVLQVPGYTRKTEREWSYSEKVQQVLSDYMAKYILSRLLLTTSVIHLPFM